MDKPGQLIDGSTITALALRALGVDIVFSVSGDQVLSLYDAFDRHGIRIVHTRHEASAVYMAAAWGALKNRPGVALVTAGPGHLSAIVALAAATLAENPVMMISGSSPVGLAGMGAFQELDQVGVAKHVCLLASEVNSISDIMSEISRAWHCSNGGVRKSGILGAVSLSIPVDILEDKVDREAIGELVQAPVAVIPDEKDGMLEGDSDAIKERSTAETVSAKLADEIHKAKRPVLLLRPSLARPHSKSLARSLNRKIPVLFVESPRGGKDPLWGQRKVLLERADLLVVLGPVDYAIGLDNPSIQITGHIIQVSSRMGEIKAAKRRSKLGNIELKESRLASEVLVLDKLSSKLGIMPEGHSVSASVSWEAGVVEVEKEKRSFGKDASLGSDLDGLHPASVVATVRPYIRREDIIIEDGGEFGQWVRAGLRDCVNETIVNGKLGAIGGSIPQGVGAALATSTRVWVFLGDGTFGYNASEIDTADREGVEMFVIVGNDNRWSAEWHHQIERYGPNRGVATDLVARSLDKVARGWGGCGQKISTISELEEALTKPVGTKCLVKCLDVMLASIPSKYAK